MTAPEIEAFVPQSEIPDGLPPNPEAIWYGTPELWTSVHPEGEIWMDLPRAADGTLTQKTFWWSRDFVSITDPEPDITISAKRIDGSGAAVTARITNGGNPEQGVFVVAGLQIPQEGCWRITAEYRDIALTYIVWVGDE